MNVRRGNFERRVAESGSLREMSRSRSRRESMERGARVAETGTLRGREGSITSVAPPVIDEVEIDEIFGDELKIEAGNG